MNYSRHRDVPIKPDLSAARLRPAAYLERAVLASAAKAIFPRLAPTPEAYAKERWNDGVTELILRGASAPAMTTNMSWAGVLAADAITDFIASLAPMSAAAKLFNAAPRVSLVGFNSLQFPGRSGAINPDYLPWVAEGEPAPVLRFNLSNAATLGPMKKLMAIAVTSRECAESGSADTVITTLLRENCALSLDASLFSNAAATAARPAGILDGVTPLPAAPNGDDAALSADLIALAGAVGSVSNGLAYIMNPAQAAAVRLKRGTTFPGDIPVWSTIAVPAGSVVAVDPLAFISAFGAEPQIESSIEAVLHYDDSDPQPPGADGPLSSLFQTDALAIKLRLPAAWTMRQAGAVAWIQNATWLVAP